MSESHTIWEGALRFIRRLFSTTLIITTIFLPLVINWESDLKFVLWLIASFGMLVTREHFKFLLPAYWGGTLLAVCSLPLFYRNIPELLKNTSLLSLLRAWHVGLLTSRSGYATDIALFKTKKLFVAILFSISLLIDSVATFLIMRLLEYSMEASVLMAAISPAPSPEVALPLFEYVTSTCDPVEDDLKSVNEAEARIRRLEESRQELTSTLNTFKATALFLILMTIAAFCAIASGVHLDNQKYDNSAIRIDWVITAINLGWGIVCALVFSFGSFVLGRLLVAEDAPPHTIAGVLVCMGSLSMFYFGSYVPVASALAAIGGCLCLRQSIGLNERASSLLSELWPYTSHLYYSTFAYVIVGLYLSDGTMLKQHWWKVLVGSLPPFFIKFASLTFISRAFKVSWPASLTLAASLCSKGTVQIALSPIVIFKLESVKEDGKLTDFGTLQLFVLMNQLCILPLIYAVAWGTRRFVRR